jgi:hypothetical protein
MRPDSNRSALLRLTAAAALVSSLAGCGGITTTASDGGGGDAREGGPCPDASKPRFEAGAGACRGGTPLLVGGKDTGFSTCSGMAEGSPILHRPAVTSCPNLLVEAKVASCTDVSGTCKTAADCQDAGPVVACILDDCAIAGYCDCRAGCVEDSQCPAKGEFAPHSVCLCAAPIGECDDAYCTSDSQCGPGMLCATGAGNTFTCQTPADSCLTDADCPPLCGAETGCMNECMVDPKGPRKCVAVCPHRGP